MTVQNSDHPAPMRIQRRKVLALGAAGLVSMALSACGADAAATATGVSSTVAAVGSTVQVAATQVASMAPAAGSTVQAAVSQVPGGATGLAATGQAIASQNPGSGATVQAIASQNPGSGATVQAIASQNPVNGATVQAVASQNPVSGSTVQAAGSVLQSAATQVAGSVPAISGTAQAAATQVAGGTTGGDPASRNNKYQGKPPAMTIDKSKKYIATIVTNKGTMKAELYADNAPISVNNFVFLANDHFYDNVIFHRIVKGFVIQGGDPTGLGTGGPGYKFADEPTSFTRSYEKGTLAMANSGPNTNGSQFFICLDNLTASNKLPKMYNIFGKVTDGLDVVDKIAATPTAKGASGENSTPTERVFMQTVTVSTQ